MRFLILAFASFTFLGCAGLLFKESTPIARGPAASCPPNCEPDQIQGMRDDAARAARGNDIKEKVAAVLESAEGTALMNKVMVSLQSDKRAGVTLASCRSRGVESSMEVRGCIISRLIENVR